MGHKPLKSIWLFKDGQFVGRRWVVRDAQDEQVSLENDSISAPAMAAFDACEKTQAVEASLSEQLSRKIG